MFFSIIKFVKVWVHLIHFLSRKKENNYSGILIQSRCTSPSNVPPHFVSDFILYESTRSSSFIILSAKPPSSLQSF